MNRVLFQTHWVIMKRSMKFSFSEIIKIHPLNDLPSHSIWTQKGFISEKYLKKTAFIMNMLMISQTVSVNDIHRDQQSKRQQAISFFRLIQLLKSKKMPH